MISAVYCLISELWTVDVSVGLRTDGRQTGLLGPDLPRPPLLLGQPLQGGGSQWPPPLLSRLHRTDQEGNFGLNLFSDQMRSRTRISKIPFSLPSASSRCPWRWVWGWPGSSCWESRTSSQSSSPPPARTRSSDLRASPAQASRLTGSLSSNLPQYSDVWCWLRTRGLQWTAGDVRWQWRILQATHCSLPLSVPDISGITPTDSTS